MRAPARPPPQCRAWLGLGRLGPGQGLGPRPHRRHGPATRLLSPACQAPAQTPPEPEKAGSARGRSAATPCRLQSTALCAARRRGAAGGAPSPDVAKGSAPSTPCRRRSPTRRRDEQTALQVPSPRPAQATSPCSAGLGPAGPRTLGLGQRACSPSLERLAGPVAARTSPPSSPEELRRNKRQLQAPLSLNFNRNIPTPLRGDNGSASRRDEHEGDVTAGRPCAQIRALTPVWKTRLRIQRVSPHDVRLG